MSNSHHLSQKNIYVVLGMPRSGTSVIARGLKALGIELGDKLTKANSLWNPKGFFEDNDIVYKVNRGVLFALDCSGTSVNLIDNLSLNNEHLRDLKKLAIELLKQRIASTTHWGFKDPRTAKILPFWVDVFNALNLKDHYIIALRNPLASAYSYQRLSGMDLEVGLMLWLMHLIPAIDGTHGKKRVMVSYELMLKDPRKELSRIKNQLNILTHTDSTEIDNYVSQFLDKKLRHYEMDEMDLKTHKAVAIAPLVEKLYTLFMRLAQDELLFDSEVFLKTWQQLKDEFKEIYPIYGYIDVLLKRNKQLERKIRTIHKSIPWHLIYPLRMIDDLLRWRRRRARKKKKTSTRSNPMKNELNVLRKAVNEAGDTILAWQRKGLAVFKKSNNDIVTKADVEANDILKNHLIGAYPEDGWLSEESVDDDMRLNSKRVWIVDPIDGTSEYANGIDEFAVSVALVQDGVPILAVVFNPARNEFFYAIKGQGAWLNDKQIQCATNASDKLFLLSSRSEYQRGEWAKFEQHHHVQPVGSIAYKLALIAAGYANATFSLGPKNEWDIAAGALLVLEAGGMVSNKYKDPICFNQRKVAVEGIVASSAEVNDRLFSLIMPCVFVEK